MDLRQIRYFLNLAETLNFTQAAALSDIAQPTLTKAIQKLEDELGGPLVYRDGKDTRLTELGRALRAEFEKIIASEMRALELADEIVNEERTVIRIGIASTLGPKPIIGFLAAFLDDMPNVEIILEAIEPKRASQVLLAGTLDACFCIDADPSNAKLDGVHLYKEGLRVASAPAHRFDQLREVPRSAMGKEPYLDRGNCEFRQRLIDHFMEHDVVMRPRLRCDREDWIEEAIAQGLGVAMVPEFSLRQDAIILTRLAGAEFDRDVYLTSVSGPATSPAIRRMREAAKTYPWPKPKE